MKNDIKNLSLEEKLKLLTGKTYWNTNDINGKLDYVVMADGPNGLRKNIDGKKYPSTSMPSAVGLQCSGQSVAFVHLTCRILSV